ncbi:hypothetical protein ACUZXZ_16100 [Pseudomonas juntendi]|uniref:hypothetical protein n=1 Tax=Pseudomonas juntendi TaxID=2666183 RepID=UPI001F27B083|nr:hypothetical protein [Pseudomonas juntendi]MCO7055087.1 hypothetical protein [Pseudomonas juntendi]UJM10760.1 hypothetical protein L1P09_15590 [Pseudomonas juntendi]
MKIDWDKEDLAGKLSDLFAEFFMGKIDGDTPMQEVRSRAELAGSLLGRAVAVIQHEGPISADIAVTIRSFEQRFSKEIADNVGKMGSPGGQLRELWNQAADIE